MKHRTGLALGLVLLSGTAVAAPPSIPMPLDLPVEVVANQHELDVVVPDTAANIGVQFGLIGALIGSSIQNAQTKHAEEAVVPLRNLLVDYPFNQRLEAAIRAQLASEGIAASSITVRDTAWEALDPQQDKSAMPAHALVLSPRYTIDNKFDSLDVAITAQVVDRSVKPNGKVKTRTDFNRRYVFHYPLPAQAGADNVARWTKLGTPALSSMLDDGIRQTVGMLAYDFSSAGRAQWDARQPSTAVTVHGVTYDGLPVKQDPDYVWMRLGRKWGQSLQGYRPVDENAPLIAGAAAVAAAPQAASTAAVDATPAATPSPVAPAADAAGAAPAPAAAAAPVATPAPGTR